MKNLALKTHKLIMLYLKWGWPILVLDTALAAWAGEPGTLLRIFINNAAFGWILCAPVAPVTFLLDRARREHLMARLCGLKEGDERERMVTGEAARATLLFSLSIQTVLLVIGLVTVQLSWNPSPPKGEKHGVLSVGLRLPLSHLNPFGLHHDIEQAPGPEKNDRTKIEGYLLEPSIFPVLALMILAQLAVFKAFATRRYQGNA